MLPILMLLNLSLNIITFPTDKIILCICHVVVDVHVWYVAAVWEMPHPNSIVLLSPLTAFWRLCEVARWYCRHCWFRGWVQVWRGYVLFRTFCFLRMSSVSDERMTVALQCFGVVVMAKRRPRPAVADLFSKMILNNCFRFRIIGQIYFRRAQCKEQSTQRERNTYKTL